MRTALQYGFQGVTSRTERFLPQLPAARITDVYRSSQLCRLHVLRMTRFYTHIQFTH